MKFVISLFRRVLDFWMALTWMYLNWNWFYFILTAKFGEYVYA